MGLTDASGDLAGEMEVDAFSGLFPFRFYERHLLESIRPDAKDTTVALGAVASADGSALVKIGHTASAFIVCYYNAGCYQNGSYDSCLCVTWRGLHRPSRPAEAAPVLSIQLTDIILSSGMVDLKELCLIPGKAAWMAYLVLFANYQIQPQGYAGKATIYWGNYIMVDLKELCLIPGKAAWMAYLASYCSSVPKNMKKNVDHRGTHPVLHIVRCNCSLHQFYLDIPLSFYCPNNIYRHINHVCMPVVSVNDEGRVFAISEEQIEGKSLKELLNRGKRKLTLSCIPLALTCILHKKYILAEPTAEEESVMETLATVVLDMSGRLVSRWNISCLHDCIALTRQRVKELQEILNEVIANMELD
ncbi:hypothetical protein IFM89_006020 [Coptis chinensis]|uniref:Uncharacterized protein n=1 Tax=Coptis chinensis TaxID=261450 RepID=A0A835LTZ2_9MAGN|nr:hypothetical protein IFM89_006020 [Coptis chinensis]